MIKSTARLVQVDESMKVGTGWAVHLPAEVSAQLPSKGMRMIQGTINGQEFTAPVEPNGDGGHWFRVKGAVKKAAGSKNGDEAEVEFKAVKDWPEPKVPADFKQALTSDPGATEAWHDITPAARWDWIRWIGAGVKAETRVKRIETAIDMLNHGKRRPCCFNRNARTLTDA